MIGFLAALYALRHAYRNRFHLYGDGWHDDTRAIQRVIDGAAKRDEAAWLPSGTFKVTNTLRGGGS